MKALLAKFLLRASYLAGKHFGWGTFWLGDILAGGPGFEPRLTESESAVLPLNYPPAGANFINCEPCV